jgi:aspartyl-tRNA(Asn)/glutamyl-tRNA(Gln) amidotransferase subunit B
MEYEAVIGLEVHVHLKTKTKAFCGCSTEFGNEPNSQTCPVCLGFPGSLPVLNRLALDYAIKVGLALNCQIQRFTKFDRKNYYYPDLPKNYQISQYDIPLAKEGFLEISLNGATRCIGILRVHLEEDAGKLIHKNEESLVDFNRSGMPLLEIVTKPEIYSVDEAYEYLTDLKSVIQYLGVSDCDMEKGSLRCDANVSVRKKGEKELGTKTEVKNLNSFKNVRDALNFEINRQIGLLNNGEKIIQETRLWNAQSLKTFSMRSKEEAKDYRYFPEPDLPAFTMSEEKIESIRKTIPELPKEKQQRFIKEYGLTVYDSKILVFFQETADYAEECIKLYPSSDKKNVANWLISSVAASANSRNCSITDLKISASSLIGLIGFVDKQAISNSTAKSVLEEMIDTGKKAGVIIEEKNLVQISDESSLIKEIDAAIRENPQSVEAFKSGKVNAIMFLVGQVMKKTNGKANPKAVGDILKRRLSDA